MKREDIKKLLPDISDDILGQIMDLHSADVGEKQKQITTLTTERDTLQGQLTEANEKIKSYTDMDIEGIKQSAKDWETKYNTDTQALKDKLAAALPDVVRTAPEAEEVPAAEEAPAGEAAPEEAPAEAEKAPAEPEAVSEEEPPEEEGPTESEDAPEEEPPAEEEPAPEEGPAAKKRRRLWIALAAAAIVVVILVIALCLK